MPTRRPSRFSDLELDAYLDAQLESPAGAPAPARVVPLVPPARLGEPYREALEDPPAATRMTEAEFSALLGGAVAAVAVERRSARLWAEARRQGGAWGAALPAVPPWASAIPLASGELEDLFGD